MILFARVVLAACALLVAGCWQSQQLLLDQGSGARAVPDGVYTNDKGETTDVTWSGGGWYRVDNMRVLLNPLPAADGPLGTAYAYAEEERGGYAYGLLWVKANEVRSLHGSCDLYHALATRYGAEIRGDDFDSGCWFRSAPQLRSALTELARQPDTTAAALLHTGPAPSAVR